MHKSEFKRGKLITYRWWKWGHDKNPDINPEHVEALEETADEHIREMMVQGYVCGTLHDNIHMTDDDPEDGVNYAGCWKVVDLDDMSSFDKILDLITEVVYATELHYKEIKKLDKYKRHIGLGDIIDGMDISIEKLKEAIQGLHKLNAIQGLQKLNPKK